MSRFRFLECLHDFACGDSACPVELLFEPRSPEQGGPCEGHPVRPFRSEAAVSPKPELRFTVAVQDGFCTGCLANVTVGTAAAARRADARFTPRASPGPTRPPRRHAWTRCRPC